MFNFDQDLEDYGSCLEELTTAVKTALWTSIQGKSIIGGERRFWSSVLFTRLGTIGRSLFILCPKPHQGGFEGNWDFASIASLTRNLFEGAAFFHYFTQRVSELEWLARLNLMQLNDAVLRIKMFEQLENQAEADAFKKEANTLRAKLETNHFFRSLDEKARKQLLQGHRASLYSLRENVERWESDPRVWGFFELLSSHTHTLPLSFYRMAEQGRTGVENDAERTYIAAAMTMAASILKNATESFRDDFGEIKRFLDMPMGMTFDDLATASSDTPQPALNRAERRKLAKVSGKRR